jgi:hypothetical protein
MPDKLFKFRCVYCSNETKIHVEVPTTGGRKGKKIQIARYCEHCRKPNLIDISETWDETGLVLGDEDGVLGYSEGIPILQGEQSK